MLSLLLIPLCVGLLIMGAKVPKLAQNFSPKPRPRAVVESSFKSSEDASSKSVLAAVLPAAVQASFTPTLISISFLPEAFTFSSVISPESDARSPPVAVS